MKINVRPSTLTNAKMATDLEANHNTKDQEKLVEGIVNQFRKKFVDRLLYQIVVKSLILHVDKLRKVFVERFHENSVTRFRDTTAARYCLKSSLRWSKISFFDFRLEYIWANSCVISDSKKKLQQRSKTKMRESSIERMCSSRKRTMPGCSKTEMLTSKNLWT